MSSDHLVVFVPLGLVAMALTLLAKHKAMPQASYQDAYGQALLALEGRSGYWVFPFWLVVSSLAGLVVPVALGARGEWFQTPAGVVTSINYTILVPALAASYVSLVRRFQVFCNENAISYDVSQPWRTLLRGALFLVPLVVIVAAVDSVLDDGHPTPWVSCEQLTVSGVLYYLLRGVNTYLAVGLFATSMVVFSRCGRLGPQGKLRVFGEALRPTREARNLVFALSLCLLFGPLVTAMHGVATFLEPTKVTAKELLASTWLWWAVATLLSTYFAAMAILALRGRALDEVDTAFASIARADQPVDEQLQSEAKTRRVALRSLIPMQSTAVVYGSVVLQVINVALPWMRAAGVERQGG